MIDVIALVERALLVEGYNPNHDKAGRFAEAPGGGGVAVAPEASRVTWRTGPSGDIGKVGLDQDAISSMFDAGPGYTTRINAAEYEPITEHGLIRASIFKNDQLAATWLVNQLDGKTAHISEVQVLGDAQGQGIAATIMGNMARGFRQAGYKRMALLADITVGLYAWARLGFEYRDPGQAAKATNKFARWAETRGIKEPLGGWPKFTSAAQVAAYRQPGVEVEGGWVLNRAVPRDARLPLGKAFMLDTAHDGHGMWIGEYRL